MRNIIFGWGIALVLLSSVGLSVSRIAHAENLTSANYQILAPVITSGGGYASSSSYSLLGVISEFAHNTASSLSSFGSNPGFAAFPFVSTPVVSATAGNASVSLSWTAAVGVLGYSVSGYSIGQSSVSGGPYSFSSVAAPLSGSVSSLTNGTTYYFVVRAHDPYNIVIATSSEVSATPVNPCAGVTTCGVCGNPACSNNNGGGGGGGGGGGTIIPPVSNTGVNFSGRAYPSSTVTILKDATIVATTIAGSDAMFQVTINNLTAGNVIFSLYSEDNNGNRSSLLSFPVSLTTGVITNVTGIFIAPTISADKSEVQRGDTITLFGQSAPQSDILISVHSSDTYFGKTISDKSGVYLYDFDSSALDYGSHSAQSKAMIGNQLVSGLSPAVAFKVGTKNVLAPKTTKCSIVGDLNADCKVNLVDFSIMAYWYKRTLSGSGFKADLNHDNKVNLVDFSILASHWTG